MRKCSAKTRLVKRCPGWRGEVEGNWQVDPVYRVSPIVVAHQRWGCAPFTHV